MNNDIQKLVEYVLKSEYSNFLNHIRASYSLPEKNIDEAAVKDKNHIYGAAIRVWQSIQGQEYYECPHCGRKSNKYIY